MEGCTTTKDASSIEGCELMGPTPSLNSKRWAEQEQPPVIANRRGSSKNQFYCVALVGRLGCGKAASTRVIERSPKIFGATEEEALQRREEFIQEYLNPRQRIASQKKRLRSEVAPNAEDKDESKLARLPIKRSAATRCSEKLREERLGHGAQGGSAGGPGRGHTFEFKVHGQPELLPSVPSTSANWFEQLQLKEKWRTARIQQLETHLAEARTEVQKSKAANVELRARVSATHVVRLFKCAPV